MNGHASAIPAPQTLPPLDDSKVRKENPAIFFRFISENAKICFYVAEGSEIKGGRVFYGYAVLPQLTYALRITVSESDLKAGRWIGKANMKLDPAFQPGEWHMFKNQHFPPAPRFWGGQRKEAAPKPANK